MSRILVVSNFYLPGYRGGGAMRTIANIVDRLGRRYEFWVLTRDHDCGDATPYADVARDRWSAGVNARVFYASKKTMGLSRLRRAIEEAAPHAIYLNSVFAPLVLRTLMLRRFGVMRRLPVIVAPEGELCPGAFELKQVKKRAFLAVAGRAGLYRDVIWKAASVQEADAIRRMMGNRNEVLVAPNLPARALEAWPDDAARPVKQAGEVALVFLSRITRKKNLHFVLDVVARAAGRVTLDIYGPIEDAAYWRKCVGRLHRLPPNVSAGYRGPVSYERVGEALARHHALVLPTLSENFGHVVLEALAAGCPVLVSDQTPWTGLRERNVGWDLPLAGPGPWRAALDEIIEMPESTYTRMSTAAREFARSWLASGSLDTDTEGVLVKALGAGGRG